MARASVADYGGIVAGAPLDVHRHDVSMRVQELRDKLTSQSGTAPAFDHELVVQFAKNRLSTAFLVPLLAIATAGVGSIWFPIVPLIAWLAGVLTMNAVIIASCSHFSRKSLDGTAINRWRKRFSAIEAMHGLAWSLIYALPIVSSDPITGQMFLFVLTLLVIAVSAMLSSSQPAAVWSCTLPVALGLVMRFALKLEPVPLTMAMMTIAAEGFFLVLSHRLYTATLDGLSMRAEQGRLIRELEQAKIASDEARRHAEASNLAKSRFLATMSHELRTPLNAILGFSEVMQAEILGPFGNPTYKEYAGDIHASGQHLLNLINEILDLSRVEAGRFELNEESISLVTTVDDCLRLVALRASSKGITLKQTFEEFMPNLWADERAIRQITLNIMSNAIKFTPGNGTIFIKAGWTAGGGQYLSIRDTGPGILDDEIPVVLSSFGQGTNALKIAEQGAGLGLPIVRGLVDLHGGIFTFKSKLKVGTEVTVTFPANRVMQPLAAVPQSESMAELPTELKRTSQAA